MKSAFTYWRIKLFSKVFIQLIIIVLCVGGMSTPLHSQSLDFQNAIYFTASGNVLTSSDEDLSGFDFSTAVTSHPLFNDGLYYPVKDYQGKNIWVRVRHIAADPNGINTGHHVTATSSSPFRSGGFGGWWGFLYQFDIFQDTNSTGAPANVLNGSFKTAILVESIETLSDTEWVLFQITNDANSAWVLNSIDFTGVNPDSNPGFSGSNIPYDSNGFSESFPAASSTLSVIDFPSGGFSEFSMSANSVSQFLYGYEYAGSGGYQGMRLTFGTAPLLPAIVSFNPTSGQAGTVVTITGFNFDPEAINNVVKFNGTTAVVSSSTTTSITTTVPAGATTGRITVTIDGHTAMSTSDFIVNAAISITAQPVSGSACSGQTASLNVSASGTSNLKYQWQKKNGTVFNSISDGAIYSGSSTSTLVINLSPNEAGDYRCVVSGDNAADINSNTASLIVNPVPSPPSVTNASGCSPSASVTLIASGAANGQYKWYTVATVGTALQGEVNNIYKTPLITTTTKYYVAINNGSCESTQTEAIATIAVCNQPPVMTTASAVIQLQSEATFNLLELINDPDDNLDPSSLTISKQPLSGASASINANGLLRINYAGLAFAGKDKLTIRVCDFAASCSEQEITIEVAGDIVVYNAFSPNGDSKNDFLFLQYIEVLPDTKKNRVSILNRWGDVVFEVDDYNNDDKVFKGLSNSGKELTSGTYYYRIHFASGRSPKNGFIYLKH